MGGLDIVADNASTMVGGSAAREVNLKVDQLAGNRIVDSARPFLEQSSAHSVVFIASTAGLEHCVGAFAYSAIKAGLMAHLNDLA